MRIIHGLALIALILGIYLTWLAGSAGASGFSLLIWPVALVGAVYGAALSVMAQYAPQQLVKFWRWWLGRLGR